MATLKEPTPPRPIAPGDVVAAFSEYLGEWTAAQITNLDPDHQLAGVLHLDWSGPEPVSVAELGEVVPLSRTRGFCTGQLAHCHYEWVLPRSYKVIGTLPLLHDQPAQSYAFGWGMGLDLAIERRRRQGDESKWSDPWAKSITGTELNESLAGPADPDVETRRAGRGIADQAAAAAKVLHAEHGGDVHIATLMLSFDLATGRAGVIEAGSPQVWRQRGKNVERLFFAAQPPLGIIDEGTYAPQEFHVLPGDRLVIVSDGVYAAHSPGGEAYEERGLARAITAATLLPAADVPGAVLRELTRHRDAVADDDALVLCLDWRGRSSPSGRLTPPAMEPI
ncbi:PP2C family protein-serine/threonine phosphatase [Streptomyces sp. DSM 41987]|uniref:PP2C family protein-serine/threonine phosphatase n=1 Tax=Streptomyces TaxID=1883 RepID=UPI00361FC062